MEYKSIIKGKFISRPNRFIAVVEIDGNEEICHVKNTGRCKELLVYGAEVYLEKSDNNKRKTQYDLVVVKKGNTLINIDSQAPNQVFYEWAKEYFGKTAIICPETKYKNSRFDCYIETKDSKIFAEVKGVTLEKNGIARFPDAPTERGIKHIEELCEAVLEGYTSYIFFIVQMKGIKHFEPNTQTHPQFEKALEKAYKCGVKIMCLDCVVTKNSLTVDNFVDVYLGGKKI